MDKKETWDCGAIRGLEYSAEAILLRSQKKYRIDSN